MKDMYNEAVAWLNSKKQETSEHVAEVERLVSQHQYGIAVKRELTELMTRILTTP